MTDSHATGSRAAKPPLFADALSAESRWAFDLLDEIDPRGRFTRAEVDVAIRCIIFTKRRVEADRG